MSELPTNIAGLLNIATRAGYKVIRINVTPDTYISLLDEPAFLSEHGYSYLLGCPVEVKEEQEQPFTITVQSKSGKEGTVIGLGYKVIADFENDQSSGD